jgi:hypothetical protein
MTAVYPAHQQMTPNHGTIINYLLYFQVAGSLNLFVKIADRVFVHHIRYQL